MKIEAAKIEVERALAVRAAWLSYVGGVNQSEIAEQLGISKIKVHRLIQFAHREGRVRVFVEGSAHQCIEIERRLCAEFQLDACEVVPNVSDNDPPFDALGAAGARFLIRRLQDPALKLIGIGHGRTLASVVEWLPSIERGDVDVVALLGCLTRAATADPFDVIHQLASKMAGKCYLLPAPFVADDSEAQQILASQKSVQDLMGLGRRASFKIMGIGEVMPDAHMVRSGMITPGELAELRAAGAVGEAAGHFFDRDGREIWTSLKDRVIGVSLDDVRGGETVAVAGGLGKVEALRAVLRAGLFRCLITDERTGSALVAPPLSNSGCSRANGS